VSGFLKTMGGASPTELDRQEAKRLAREAVRIGKDDAFALAWAGYGLAMFAKTTAEIEEGNALVDRALTLNPNLARCWNLSGWVKIWLGQIDTAIVHIERAMRLSPLDHAFHAMEAAMCSAHLRAGRYDQAAQWAERSLHSNPHFNTVAAYNLVLCRAYLGDLEKARSAGARLLQMIPAFRISTFPAVQNAPEERRPIIIEALRNAGLPE
jgi:tetratricopeptide (TPR) repeat protein